jgi:hypothetical protein
MFGLPNMATEWFTCFSHIATTSLPPHHFLCASLPGGLDGRQEVAGVSGVEPGVHAICNGV